MLRATQCLCIGGLKQTLHLVAIIPLVSMKLCSTCFRATSIHACSCVCVCVCVREEGIYANDELLDLLVVYNNF